MAWEMREEAAKRNQAANKEREARDKLKEQAKKDIDIDENGITKERGDDGLFITLVPNVF